MKKVIRILVKNKFSWSILHTLYKVFYRFKFEKDLIEIEKDQKELNLRESIIKEKFKDLIVQNGLFKGMKYPDFSSNGSALYPKLLGCYESELHSEFELLLKNDYSKIIDIGCAEGYYAVGCAMLKKNSTILAYDVNKSALDACKKMADVNNVKNIDFASYCSSEKLTKINYGIKSLIICDCEGYEIDLFNSSNINYLKNCDVLIELHDLYNESISYKLEKIFSKTHDVKYIYSENTFKRLEKLNFINNYTEEQIKSFFVERNGIMQWVIFTPKK